MKHTRTFAKVISATAALALSASMAMAANIDIIGGKNDDAFWNKIKKGVDDARLVVEANGGKVKYLRLQTYDNFAANVAELIRTAISEKPDGIAVPDWVPASENAPLQEAVKSGIKVMLFNSGGIDEARKIGALNYVGADEYKSGEAAGAYMAKHGQKDIICANTLPGTANIEARCKGMIDAATKAGIKATELPLPSTSFGNPTAIAEAIKATLIKHPEIDGVVTIGAGDADAAAIGIQQAGKTGKVMLGCFDFNQQTLDRIENGTQLFAVDQQPYLQSLLAVELLAANIDFGTRLPTAPILTGPGIVDASNVKATIAGVKAGAR